MERLKARSRGESRRTRRVESGTSTPEPPREGVFTPTADQELEAILAKVRDIYDITLIMSLLEIKFLSKLS